MKANLTKKVSADVYYLLQDLEVRAGEIERAFQGQQYQLSVDQAILITQIMYNLECAWPEGDVAWMQLIGDCASTAVINFNDKENRRLFLQEMRQVLHNLKEFLKYVNNM